MGRSLSMLALGERPRSHLDRQPHPTSAILCHVARTAEGGEGDTMLTVSEETTLLLYYTRVPPAGSSDEYDTLSRFGVEIRLLAGAVLMDLVLLGKVQVRPVSLATRRLLATSRLLFSLLFVSLFLFLPSLASVILCRLQGMHL